jgi:hypothetical protein
MKPMAEGSSSRTDRRQAKEATLVRGRLFLALLLLLGAPLLAQEPVPLGPSFVVNNNSVYPHGQASVSRSPDGGFVVAWIGMDNGGSTESTVHARLFDAEGSPGDQFQVDRPTPNLEWHPDVEILTDERFVIVWAGPGAPTQGPEIYGRIFSAAGLPISDEFRVNANTVGQQWRPIAIALEDGGFYVVWDDEGGGGIAGRRFDAQGQPVGFQVRVDDGPGCCKGPARASSDGGGGFVVAWDEGPAHDESVQARLFTADAVPRGGQFQVNTYTTQSSQHHSTVSPDGSGGFVVVWTSTGSFGDDTQSTSVQAQRLTSDGVKVGGQFQVNTATTGQQRYPSVGEDGAGGFVVVWGDESEGTSFPRLLGQRYSADGDAIGQEFPVGADERRSRVAGLGGDRFVVVWSIGDVWGRRFVVPLFADGFESGDTSAWASTVP